MTTYTWTDVGSVGVWADPNNWSPNGIPGNGDSIIINNGDNVAVSYQDSPDLGGIFISPTSTLAAYGGFHPSSFKIDGPIAGGGTLYIGPLSTIEAGSGVTSAVGTVTVQGTYQWGGSDSSQMVTLSPGAHFNFSTQFGGTIDEYGTGATTITYNGPGAVSSISVAGQTATFVTTAGNYTLNFAGDLNPSGFILDAATGTIIVCLATGTLVHTTRGNVPVEELRLGDVAITASSQYRPIRWIGSTELDCINMNDSQACFPIRITAGAFGPAKPASDLFVSPAHGICTTVVTDILIPASALVNGATIVQEECAKVTYWHVELDEHDILITNGLPTESYIDHGNRGFFSHAIGSPTRSTRGADQRCLGYVSEGPLVEAVRMQLRTRALAMGWTLSDDSFADVHLIANGQRIDPVINDWRAQFHVPASVSELSVVSEWGVPSMTVASGDGRRLGVCISGMIIKDEAGKSQHIGAGDGRLCDGFHQLEDDRRRWTDGRARLPPSLWEGCRGPFSLTVDFGGPAVPRWVPPLFHENHETVALSMWAA